MLSVTLLSNIQAMSCWERKMHIGRLERDKTTSFGSRSENFENRKFWNWHPHPQRCPINATKLLFAPLNIFKISGWSKSFSFFGQNDYLHAKSAVLNLKPGKWGIWRKFSCYENDFWFEVLAMKSQPRKICFEISKMFKFIHIHVFGKLANNHFPFDLRFINWLLTPILIMNENVKTMKIHENLWLCYELEI